MRLVDILAPEAVRVVGKVSSKKRLFQDLGDMVQDIYGIRAEIAVAALQERENLGPTGVGDGIAFPHARLDEIDSVKGVFIRLESPLDFNSVDRQPVDLLFALFAPQASGVDHLKALATVSRTLRNPTLCAKLRANTDTAILHTMLTGNEASQAA